MHDDESEFNLPTAEFMFDSDNPAECTRQAAMILRERGWRAIMVKYACEGFKVDDFQVGEQSAYLFNQARTDGIGFSIGRVESLDEKSPQKDIFLGNWFAERRSVGRSSQ